MQHVKMLQNTIDDISTLVHVMPCTGRQQAITWDIVDKDISCHMVSLGHNVLKLIFNTHYLVLFLWLPKKHLYTPREHHIHIWQMSNSLALEPLLLTWFNFSAK